MRIVLFGPPGAGKGTQARLLEERHSLTQIATGDIIREAMKNETPVGKEAKSYVEKGELVPDSVVRKLAEQAIADPSLHVPDDVIVDRLSKRRMHKETGDTYHLDHNPPPADVDDDMIIQRDDDRPETVRNRLAVYRDETEPLEEYYRERDLLVVVNGVGDIEDVHGRILDALEQAQTSARAE